MAIDTAFSTGQRQSRSARSGSAQFETPRATERSRDFAQTHVAPGVDAQPNFGALNSALDGFFNKAVSAFEKDRAERQAQEDAEEIARIEAEVRSNRDGAREAIRTGDFSKFITPTNRSARRQRAITNSFLQVAGAAAADEDFDRELNDAIRQTPPEGDPGQAIEAFLEKNTEGANPLFAQAYTRRAITRAQPAQRLWRKARLELTQVRAETSATALVTSDITNNVTSPTAEGIDKMRTTIIGSMPVNGPEAVMRADAIIDNEIIRLAAEGDPLAMKLGTLPDPKRGGTSVFARNPGALERSVSAAITRASQTKTVAARKSLNGLEERLRMIEAGASKETVGDLWADTIKHGNSHGKDDAPYKSFANKMAKAFGAQAAFRRIDAAVTAGSTPTANTQEWNKYASRAWGSLDTADPDKRTAIYRAIARRGSGNELKNHNSHRLTSGNAEEAMETFQKLAVIDGADDLRMEDRHLTEGAADVYHLMRAAVVAGQNPMEWRDRFLEARNNDHEANPNTYFERQLVNAGSKTAKQNGVAGAMVLAKKVWDGMDSATLERTGWLVDTKQSFSQLPPAVQNQIKKMVNRSAFLLSGNTADPDTIATVAGSLLKGHFGLELDADGNEVTTVNQAPPVGVAADGTILPAKPFTKETAERARKSMEGMKPFLSLMGASGALRQDRLTAAGHGMAVTVGTDGVERDVLLVPSQRFEMPMDAALDQLVTMSPVVSIVSRDDKRKSVFMEVKAKPGPDDPKRIPLNDNLFMVYDDDRGGWTMRWADKGAPKKSLEELNAENKKRREASLSEANRRGAGSNTRARAALDRLSVDAEEREASFGSGLQIDEAAPTGPSTGVEQEAEGDFTEETLNVLSERGIVSPQARREADEENPDGSLGKPH